MSALCKSLTVCHRFMPKAFPDIWIRRDVLSKKNTMHTACKLFICILLFEALSVCIGEVKTPITCAAGTYYTGESASLTCNFHTNMRSDSRTITVNRYPKNATTGDHGKEVLVCRENTEGDERDCETVQGYEFSGEISDHLVLEVPSVNDKTAGMYTCFVIPDKGTDPHLCELIVKAGARPSQQRDEGSNYVWLLFLLIIPVVGVVLAFIFLKLRRERKKRRRMLEAGRSLDLMQPLLPVDEPMNSPLGYAPNDKVWENVKGFRLKPEDVQSVAQLLSEEMDKCQAENNNSSVKLYPVYIHSLPEKDVKSDILVVELGNPSLKIHLVKLNGERTGICSEHFGVPSEIRLGTEKLLSEHVAKCAADFRKKHDLPRVNVPVGFVFCFPSESDRDLTKTRLVKWTKEFNCRGVGSKDLGQWLQQTLSELNKVHKCSLDVVAVINDGVGTLLSVAYDDPSCKMAVTVGNGFHASFVREHRTNPRGPQDKTVIVKTELGALGENNCLESLRTEFDIELDTCSMNRGEQILEKMTSLMYLGEIVRLILQKMTKAGLVFKKTHLESSKLKERYSFDADDVSLIESDMSQGQLLTKYVLEKMQLTDVSDEDCKIVHYVCGVVLERAASLAAAGLATLINRMGHPDVTVAIDGPSLNVYHPHFHQLMQAKVQKLLKPELKFRLMSSYNGSARGAALVAACLSGSSHSKKSAATKKSVQK